jgi:hypothetical protein
MDKRPSVAIKIATILSSLLLVGGCVSYRAGVFGPIPEAKATQTAEEKNPPPADPAKSDAKKSDPVIFYGTKAPFGFSNVTPTK